MHGLIDVIRLEMPVWEMVLRGTVIYWFLLIVFRVILRRDVGSMGIADLLFVVLIADAASNAMQGEYKTVGDGLVLVSTLIAWNYLIDWSSYRWAWVSRLFEPRAAPLVRHGRIIRKALDKELIAVDELLAKLREKGIDDLSTIRIARLESDGEISVLRYGKNRAPG